MTQTYKAFVAPALLLLALIGGAALSYAQLSDAATSNANNGLGFGRGMMGFHDRPGIHGEITAIDSTVLTVKGDDGTTYTVRANEATVHTFVSGEGPQTVDMSTLKVGDTVGIHGKVDGTSVDATDIMTGVPGKGIGMGRGMGMGGFGHRGGRGVGGEVTAVDGNTITVKAPNGTSYTVDAKGATVSRVVVGSVVDIHVGDHIGVQGTVSGTNVTATRVMDDVPQQ